MKIILLMVSLFTLTTISWADTVPEVKDLNPFLVISGKTTSLTIIGDNLKLKAVSTSDKNCNVKIAAPEKQSTDKNLEGKSLVLEITSPKSKIDPIEVNLVHLDGGKGTFKVAVISDSVVATKVLQKPTQYNKPLSLSLPVVLEGNLDQDQPQFFSIALKAGQTVKISLIGSKLESILRLREPGRVCVAMDAGSISRPRLIKYAANQTGEYLLELSGEEGKGGPTARYRISIE